MKALLIGIFDTKGQTFINVEPVPNKAVAVRHLQEEVNSKTDRPFAKWPGDYELRQLGVIDMETGEITDLANTFILNLGTLKG